MDTIVDPFETQAQASDLSMGDELRAIEEKQNPQTKYATPKTWFGEAKFGLSRGIDELQQMLYGTGALATTGELHKNFLKAVKQQDEEIAASPASVPTYEHVDSFDHFMRYFAGGLGEMAPQIGESIAAGAIGAVAGSATAPGPGTAVGAIGGLIEKQAIRNLIKSGIEEGAKSELRSFATGQLEKKALSETAKSLLVNETATLGSKYGAFGAIAANSWGHESASIYTDLEQDPNIPETDKRLSSLVGGFIAAIPDAGFEGWIASKFFPGAHVTTEAIKDAENYAIRFMKTYGKEVIKVSPAEGAQEYAQTLIEEASKNYADPNKRDVIFNFTPEQKSSFVDAMFKGAIGGVLGGGVAAVGETRIGGLNPHPDPAVRQDQRDIAGKTNDLAEPVPTAEDVKLSEITKRQEEINAELIKPDTEVTPEQKVTLQTEHAKLEEEANTLLGKTTTETPLVNKQPQTPKTGQPFQTTAYRGVQESGTIYQQDGNEFFTTNPETAKTYAGEQGTVSTQELKFENPLVTENWISAKGELGLETSATMPEVLQTAKEKGYDGVIWQHHGEPEYVKLGEQKQENRPSTEGSTISENKRVVGAFNAQQMPILSPVASENLPQREVFERIAPKVTNEEFLAKKEQRDALVNNIVEAHPNKEEGQIFREAINRGLNDEALIAFADQGVNITKTQPGENANIFHVAAGPRGNITLRIPGIKNLLKQAKTLSADYSGIPLTPKDRAGYLNATDSVMTHEIFHVAQFVAERQRWIKEGKQGTFNEYHANNSVEIGKSMRALGKDFRFRELFKGLPTITQQVYNYGNFGSLDNQTLGDEIPRMAAELARTGRIDEFTGALVRLKAESEGPKKGAISTFLKKWIQAIKSIQKVLAKLINPETSSQQFQTAFNNINKVLDNYGILVNNKAQEQQKELAKNKAANEALKSETTESAIEKQRAKESFGGIQATGERNQQTVKGKPKDVREEASRPARSAEPKGKLSNVIEVHDGNTIAVLAPTEMTTQEQWISALAKSGLNVGRGFYQAKVGDKFGLGFDPVALNEQSWTVNDLSTGEWILMPTRKKELSANSAEQLNQILHKAAFIVADEVSTKESKLHGDEYDPYGLMHDWGFKDLPVEKEPQKIIGTALNVGGEILKGPNPFSSHQEILTHHGGIEGVIEKTGEVPDLNKQGGFITDTGFVSRKEATQIAKKAGQIPQSYTGELHSQIINEQSNETTARSAEPRFTSRDERILKEASDNANQTSNNIFGTIEPKKAERKRVQGQLQFQGITPQSASYLTRTQTQTALDAQALVNEHGGGLAVAEELAKDPSGKKFKITEDILNEKDLGPNARLRAVYDNVADQLNQMIGHLEGTEASIAAKAHLYDLRELMVRQPMWIGNEAGSFNAQTGFQRLMETGMTAVKTFRDTILGTADKILGKKAKEQMERLSNSLNFLMDESNSFQLVNDPRVISILRKLNRLVDKSKFAAGYRKNVVANIKKLKAIVNNASARAAEALGDSDSSFAKADKFVEYLIKEMSLAPKEANAPDEHSVVLSALAKMVRNIAKDMGLMEEHPKFAKMSNQEKMLAILRNEDLYSYFINTMREEQTQKFNNPEEAQDLFAKLANRMWEPDMVKAIVNEKMREINETFAEIVQKNYSQGDFTKERLADGIREYMEKNGVTNEHLIEQLVGDIENQFEENISAAREKFFGSAKSLRAFLKNAQTTLAEAARQHSKYSENLTWDFAQYLVNEFSFPEQEANQLAKIMQKEFNQLVQRQRTAILERFANNIARENTNTDPKKIKGATQRILELSNLGVMRSEKVYQALQEKFGLPPYTEETAQKIQELGDLIAESKSERQKDELRQKLADYITSKKGLSTTSSYLSWMYFSMLSGLSTHLVNIGGNATNMLGYLAVESIKHPRNIPRMLHAMMRSAGGSAKLEAQHSFWTGMQLGKDGNKYFSSKNPLELPDVFFTSDTIRNKFGDALADKDIQLAGFVHKIARGIKANYVGRALVASDLYFYKIAREMAYAARTNGETAGTPEMWDSARNEAREDMLAIGRNPNGTKEERLEFQVKANAIFEQKRLVNDQDKITAWQEAHDEALTATFNNEPKYLLGTMAKYVEKFTNEMPIGKVIIPFTRISANVTNAMLEWTPFGAVRYLFQQKGNPFKLWEDGKWKPESEIAIRSILGTGMIFAMLALMADDDQDPDGFTVFGDGPRDLGKKRLLQEKGWKPNTIRIGGNYYSYLYTPLAMALSIVGRQMDDYRDGKIASAGDVSLATTAVSLMEAVKNQSFLASVTDLMSAIDSPDPQSKVLKVLSRFASIPVPNVVKQIDRFIDPSLQDAKGFTESIIKEFPIARYALNPALNVFGEPIQRTLGAIPIPGLERFVTADRTDDPVLNLLSEKSISVPGFSKNTRIGNQPMTEEQYYQYVKTAGPKIKQRIQNELGSLRMMSKEAIQDRIEKISTEEKKKARLELANSR